MRGRLSASDTPLSQGKKMQKSFSEVVEQIIGKDPRYAKEAYIFLKEALEFTIKQKRRGKSEAGSHVDAGELLDGFRQLALKEFGPMVLNLIEAGVFGKTESDSVEDFRDALNFRAAFVEPFESRSSKPANS